MENNNIDLKNALDLYESLDVSEKAKETFFKNIVLKEAEAAPDEAKKGGKMAALLNGFKKRWGGTQGTVDKMYKALDGMAQVIDTNLNVDDEKKAEYKQYLETYKAKIQTTVKNVIAANQAVENETNANPKTQELAAQEKVAEKVQDEQLAKITSAPDVATLVDNVKPTIDALNQGLDAEMAEENVKLVKESVETTLEQEGFINNDNPEATQQSLAKVNELLASATTDTEKGIYQSIIDALGGADSATSEEAEQPTEEATDETPEDGSAESSSKNAEDPSSDGASHDITKAESEKKDAKEKGKDPADVDGSDEDGDNGMNESVKPNEARI